MTPSLYTRLSKSRDKEGRDPYTYHSRSMGNTELAKFLIPEEEEEEEENATSSGRSIHSSQRLLNSLLECGIKPSIMSQGRNLADLASSCSKKRNSWTEDFLPLMESLHVHVPRVCDASGIPDDSESDIFNGACSSLEHQWPPLLYAAGNGGNDEAALALLHAGAIANTRNVNGWSPFLAACWAPRSTLVLERMLLGEGTCSGP